MKVEVQKKTGKIIFLTLLAILWVWLAYFAPSPSKYDKSYYFGADETCIQTTVGCL